MGLSLGLLYLYLVALGGAQDICQVPSFPPPGGTDFGGFLSNIQYIIPTMNFSGCGVITDWTIVGAGAGAGGTRDRIIELQLFRPDPTRSTVFTKVTSSVVTTRINQMVRTHTFTSIGFTFSPGDVLGFYYPNTVDFFEVHRTNSFSTHSVLTSANSPTASVVTLTATTKDVPLMSVSVSCTECPRSTTILSSVTTSETPILTDILSSSETVSSVTTTTSDTALFSSSSSSATVSSSTATVSFSTVTVSSSTATVSSSTATVFSSTATVPSSTVTVSSSTATVPSSTATVPSSTVTVSSSTATVFSSTATVPFSTATVSSSTVTVSSSTATVSSSTTTVFSSTVTMSSSTATVSSSTATVSSSTATVFSSTATVSSSTATVSSTTATVPTSTVTVSSSSATVSSNPATVSSNTANVSSGTATVSSSTATVSSTTATMSPGTATVFQSTALVSAPSSQSLFISGTSLSESTLSPGVPGTTTVPDVSDEVPIAAVAGGAAGGALAVLLIVIIVLIAVITAIVCVRRKKVKYVLDSHYSNSSPETVAFVNPMSTLDSVGTIVRSNTYEMSDATYFEIPDDLDQKPCSKSEKLHWGTTESSYDVPNSKAVMSGDTRHDPNQQTTKLCEGHEYYEPEDVPKGREPPPLLPRKVPAQPLYSRVLTREERLKSPETGSDENVYESPLVHFETLGRQNEESLGSPEPEGDENTYESPPVEVHSETSERHKSFSKNGIPEVIYEMSFCKEEIYCSPSGDEDGIYAQMAQWGYQEIPRASVTLSEKLGEGQFGEVYKAELKVSKERSLDVAVKLVKKGAPAEETTKLLQEAATLGQFKHRHVVRLIGVITRGEPKMILIELLPGGDLREYLLSLREDPSQLSSPDLPSLLLQFCKQVVDGLACLSRKSFVHRDIAARNILLDKDLNCKISDFGMTRGVEEDTYYLVSKGSKVPAKWTSPEALLYKKYSTSSDVWSYGMLMYEIWSLGHKPFEDKTVREMIRCLDERYCLPPPPGCPRAVYEVMVNCWNPSHNDRASASDISGEFCKSERILLSWKKEDIVSPSAQVLGGPLSEGEELYKDLQFLYRKK